MQKITSARVAVFGLGGVGGTAAEALVRAGVGAIDLIDGDKVSPTNVNRQIIATAGSVGKYKTDAAEERFLQISPNCKIFKHTKFITPENAWEFDFSLFDYVVDAIDGVAGKIAIIKRAKAAGVPIISCMGAGNKLNPMAFKVADIYKTSVCPLAKIMRRELKREGIQSLKAVYSEEPPIAPAGEPVKDGGKSAVGSVSFVPPAAGLLIASEVIKDIIK